MYLRTNYPCTQLDSRCFCVSCCIIISKSWLNQTPAILSSTPERGVHPQPCSQPALLQLVRELQRLPEKNRERAWISALHLLRDLKGFPRIMAINSSLDGAGSKPKVGWAPLMTMSSRDSWAATFLPYAKLHSANSGPILEVFRCVHSFYPHLIGLFHWHWAHQTIAPMTVKQWRIYGWHYSMIKPEQNRLPQTDVYTSWDTQLWLW